MIPDDPAFRAWCWQYGYVPVIHFPESEYQREKLARFWLAWLAGMPPDCKKAHAMVRLSGLLTL